MTAQPTPRTMQRILRRLLRAYGPRPWRRWGDGVGCLVGTILSQNTSDANSSAAYRQLRRRFGTWEQVADARASDIERCIRVAGLSRIKAPRIRRILRAIRRERGRVSLEFLRRSPPPEAYDYLRRFGGVGDKTANCVLLFAFRMPVFPVDTHIERIAKRLGLVGPRATPEQVGAALAPRIPPDDRYATHVLLIAHGRQVCRARNPRCEWCCLLAMCPYGQAGTKDE